MKIKTSFFLIDLDILLVLVTLITIFSDIVKTYLSGFYLCYLFILFHELSHMFVGAIFGFDIDQIKLSLSGVNVKFNKNITTEFNIKNILIYVAGPLSNYILALIFRKNELIFSTNIFLGTLNLLPIYPLDGYNILKIILLRLKDKEGIIDVISSFFYFFLFGIGLYQTIIYFNPSILIFLFYLFLIKTNHNKNKKRRNYMDKIVKIC